LTFSKKKGIYCLTVSDLSPSTTYYYRAGARNAAGVSYGDVKSFTTTSPLADFSVRKTVRNLSDGTAFADSMSRISFSQNSWLKDF